MTADARARANALIQKYLGPDHKVIDMAAFHSALVQALKSADEPSIYSYLRRLVSGAYVLFLPYWLWEFISRGGTIQTNKALDAAGGVLDLTIAYAILMGLIWLFEKYPPPE